MNNPFSYGTIVRGDDFYDRKEETARLTATLESGNNVVLYAPRRYGKTSLVFKVISELELRGCLCIYFDLMSVYSLESFARMFLQVVQKKQTKTERLVKMISSYIQSIKPKMSFDENGNPEFGVDFLEKDVSTQTIADLLDLPEKMAEKGQNVVVIFDEFQEITKFAKYGLEGLLRSKIQQQKTTYMFLGSKTHLLNEMFSNKKRPFYNSAMVMQIGQLPLEDTINFLQEKFSKFGITISEECCTYIVAKATNIPYYIQLLSAEIWQSVIVEKNEVTKQIIDDSCTRVVNLKKDYYAELFDKYSEGQKNLLLALCKSGSNIFSVDYVQKNRLKAISSVQKSMTVLMDSGVVDKEDIVYFISDPFFKLYLEQYSL